MLQGLKAPDVGEFVGKNPGNFLGIGLEIIGIELGILLGIICLGFPKWFPTGFS